MASRTAAINIGDATFVVSYEVNGGYAPTMTDPEEWPEIELRRLETLGGEDISGLLGFPPVYERLLEEIDEQERLTDYGRDPDPDEAYDRWRDEQLEMT